MPFADYTTWDDCIAANQDAADPEAYCGKIKAQAEGKSLNTVLLNREEVAKRCPECAKQMVEKHITHLKVKSEPAARDKDWQRFLRESVPQFQIAKLDEAQNLVFGWASVAIKSGDVLLTDLQNDQIEPPELEKAAYSFVEHSRAVNEMHRGLPVGQLVESFVVTPEKLELMGLMRKSAPQVGYWVGFRVQPDVFQKVKAGKLRMFSIEGTATRVAA